MKRQWNNDRNESRLQSFLEVKKYRGGIHGLSHAQRVEKFGLMLAEKTDADRDVIIWFAYLHDSQRTDDGFDFNHGPDAARFVDTIRNAFLQELSDTQISKLKEACRLHTSTHRTWDITIDTCFDADRLDLPRVGKMMNYLYGKGDVPDLKLKYSKMFFLMVIVPLRKHCKEYARDIVNGFI